jgi:hypothetical protein
MTRKKRTAVTYKRTRCRRCIGYTPPTIRLLGSDWGCAFATCSTVHNHGLEAGSSLRTEKLAPRRGSRMRKGLTAPDVLRSAPPLRSPAANRRCLESGRSRTIETPPSVYLSSTFVETRFESAVVESSSESAFFQNRIGKGICRSILRNPPIVRFIMPFARLFNGHFRGANFATLL